MFSDLTCFHICACWGWWAVLFFFKHCFSLYKYIWKYPFISKTLNSHLFAYLCMLRIVSCIVYLYTNIFEYIHSYPKELNSHLFEYLCMLRMASLMLEMSSLFSARFSSMFWTKILYLVLIYKISFIFQLPLLWLILFCTKIFFHFSYWPLLCLLLLNVLDKDLFHPDFTLRSLGQRF